MRVKCNMYVCKFKTTFGDEHDKPEQVLEWKACFPGYMVLNISVYPTFILRYIPFHSMSFYSVPLLCATFRDIPFHSISLHYITLQYLTLHCIANIAYTVNNAEIAWYKYTTNITFTAYSTFITNITLIAFIKYRIHYTHYIHLANMRHSTYLTCIARHPYIATALYCIALLHRHITLHYNTRRHHNIVYITIHWIAIH